MGARGRVSQEHLKRLLDDGHTRPLNPIRLSEHASGEMDTSRKVSTKRSRVKACVVQTADVTGLEPAQMTSADPLIRDTLCEMLTMRNLCTIKLEGLPKGYNYLSLLELAPDMVACRIPHIAICHRPARTAFLEFSSHESALSNQHDYNVLEVRVSNLHKKTGKGELTRHFPNAATIALKDGKSGRTKQGIGVAVISFGTPAEAVAAVNEKHGCVVRGRRVSVLFERKKSPKFVFLLPYAFRSVQGLIVYGLKRSTKESEVRAIFPQAEAIEIFPLGGFAKLRYAAFEDCKLDKKNASTVKFRGRQLKVAYLWNHSVGGNIDDKPMPQGLPSCRVFVKNLGRTANEEQDWHKIVPVLFPKHCLNLALLSGIASPLEVNERLQNGKLQLRAETTVMVNAEYIVGEAQVEAAAVQALANRASQKLQGKGPLSSEFLACLHPRHSINEAVSVFGVNKDTKYVLFVVISLVEETLVSLDDLCQLLSAKPEEITSLSTIANKQKVCAAYNVSVAELDAAPDENLGMLQSILTKMSVGMLQGSIRETASVDFAFRIFVNGHLEQLLTSSALFSGTIQTTAGLRLEVRDADNGQRDGADQLVS
ncbi:unnamed protein product [Schistocephalus solidus]|uniref:RRM domain-containing protein n=1 Tax=Schistocephalus solidus TaxID=70667 RepID=A0A183SPJ3_SCHSO|nr:unnamed protein product [Schistocephalus solidus]